MNGKLNMATNLLLAVVMLVALGMAPGPIFANKAMPEPLSNAVQNCTEVDRAGVTRRVSLASDGRQANSDSYSGSISADGRFVAFVSIASNLVSRDTNDVSDVFVQ